MLQLIYGTLVMVLLLTGNANAGTITSDIFSGNQFKGSAASKFTGRSARFSTMSGSSYGTHTGPVVGTHTGTVIGNVTGNVTGNLTGNVSGNVTGNIIGNLTGDVTGNLIGSSPGVCAVPASVATLELARTSAACLAKTVLVTTALTEAQSNISGDWPNDRGLEIRFGGSIANSTTFNFADGRVFTVGRYQTYTGVGAITGMTKPCYPENWGAKSDGTTISTTALSKALNNSAGAILSAGTYLIDDTIEIFNSNVTYEGAGVGKTIIKLKTDTTPVNGMFLYYTINSHDFHWKGITFDYNGSASNTTVSARIFDIRSAWNFTFESCEFKNVITGITDYAKASYAVILDGCIGATAYQNLFDKCRFYNYETGGIYHTQVNSTQAKSGDNLTVRDCQFSKGRRMGSNTSSGIWVIRNATDITKGGSKNTTIDNCRFDDVDDSAIIANTFNGLTITNCFAVTKGTGFYLGGYDTAQFALTVANCDVQSTTGQDVALLLDNVWYINISNNRFHDCDYEGMRVGSCWYGTITGNSAYNNGQYGTDGIGLKFNATGSNPASKYISVTGNTFFDTASGAARTQEYGIVNGNNSDFLTITGNTFYNLKTDNAVIEVPDSNTVNKCRVTANQGDAPLVTTSGTSQTFDWFFNKTYQVVLDSDVSTVVFRNAQDGDTLTLRIINSGTHTLTWPSNVRWSGTAPVVTASTTYDTYVFTFNAGNGTYIEQSRVQAVTY